MAKSGYSWLRHRGHIWRVDAFRVGVARVMGYLPEEVTLRTPLGTFHYAAENEFPYEKFWRTPGWIVNPPYDRLSREFHIADDAVNLIRNNCCVVKDVHDRLLRLPTWKMLVALFELGWYSRAKRLPSFLHPRQIRGLADDGAIDWCRTNHYVRVDSPHPLSVGFYS